MTLGYTGPLYLLPFDHRHSYVTGMFRFTTPLTADEHNIVAESKRVIYDGFRQALSEGVPSARGGILVDEEFGESILRDAIERGYVTALSTEKSGSDEFDFEYGTRFAEHIESFGPTFAKVLVRTTLRAMPRSMVARRRGSHSSPIIVGPRNNDSCSSCWSRPRRHNWTAPKGTSTSSIGRFVPD
jgi:hypothetical protein